MGPSSGGQRPFEIPDDYFKYVVFKNPAWDFRTLDFDRDVNASDQIARSVLDATDPDLSKFAGHGGKLLVYHGWSDQLITPLDTIEYYQHVLETMGAAKAQSVIRVFMVPGMAHQPPSPERIVVSYLHDGKLSRTRPVCPYPQMATYTGTDSSDEAANFTCKAP